MRIYEIESYLTNIFKKNKLLKDNYSVFIIYIANNSIFYNYESESEAKYYIFVGCLKNTKTEIPFGIRRRKFLETLLNKQLKCTTYNLKCCQEDLEKLYVLSKIMQ